MKLSTIIQQLLFGGCALAATSAIAGDTTKTRDAPPTILAAIETGFTNAKTLTADFTQTNKISLFDKPIVLKGTLRIDFPDGLEWRVLSPMRSTVAIKGDKAETWDEATGERKVFSRSENPMMSLMWKQLGAWLMGRYEVLSEDYNIETSPKSSPEAPVLVFRPKNKLIGKVVANVTLAFAKSNGMFHLSTVVMREKGGDSTTIVFSNTKVIRTNNEDSTKRLPKKSLRKKPKTGR